MKAALKRIQTGDQNLQFVQDSIQTSLDQVRAYQSKKPSNWVSPAPTNYDDAIERLASLIVSLNGGSAIP